MTEDVRIVHDACCVLQISSERLFREAYDYAELRISGKRKSHHFVNYIKHDIVPDVVRDYAIYALAGRIK
jgi:hypothetical protein